MSLVYPNCPWFILAPKVLQLSTNHCVLVLCRSVQVIEACQFFLIPSWNSSTHFYPSIMLRARERATTSYYSVVFNLGLTFESLKELGMCDNMCNQCANIMKLEKKALHQALFNTEGGRRCSKHGFCSGF